MPVPTGFQNKVRVTGLTTTDINAELASQNAAGWWLTDLRFTPGLGQAVLLLVNTSNPAYAATVPQKVNAVDIDQAAIDADIATEFVDHNWPTGIFVYDDATVYVLYSGLTGGGGE